MSPLLLAAGWAAAIACGVVVVRHHVAYYRHRRPLRFGAFMATAGWIILLLVMLRAVSAGLGDAGTRIVGIAVTVVSGLFIGIGSLLR